MGAAVQAALKADQKDVQDLVVTDIADAEPDGGGGGPELVPLRPFIYTSEEGLQAIGDDRDWTLLAAEADLEVSRPRPSANISRRHVSPRRRGPCWSLGGGRRST